MSSESDLTLGQVVRAWIRFRWTSIAIVLIGLGLSLFAYKILPRKYGSEGRLYVQAGRAHTGLDPTSSSKSLSIQDTRETEVRSVMEIIKSRAILERVAEEIGPRNILAGDWKLPVELPKFFSSSNPDSSMDEAEYHRRKELEQAVKELEEGLKVHLEKSTSVISVFCIGPSPRLAQSIVEKIMQAAREKHVEVHASAGSREFFGVELKQQESILDKAIEKQRDFRNQYGFLSVDSARATEQMVLDKLDLQLVDVDVDLEQARLRTEELAQKLKEIPPMIDTPQQGKESLSTERARSEMFSLEAERAKLLATYSEAHPQVQQKTAQIAALREELAKLPGDRTETMAVPNKTHENIQTEYVSAQAALKGLAGRRENLQAKRSEASKKLSELNQLAVESESMQRDIDIARRHLDLYIQKQGESQVLDQLDKQRISDVVVAQPAMLVVKHVSPNPLIVLPLGGLFGFMLATSLAVVRDKRSPTQYPTNLAAEEADLGALPVLTRLPRVSNRGTVVR